MVAFGTGLVALDVVQSGESSETARAWAGGTCGNVLTVLAYLGWEAYPVSTLGIDEASSLVLDDMRRFGVNIDLIRFSEDRKTPIVLEVIKEKRDGEVRHRFLRLCPSCGNWLPSYRPLGLREAMAFGDTERLPDVFFFDRASRGTLYLAQKFASTGAMVIFEPSSVSDKRLFEEAIRLSHIVKYSKDRLLELGGISHRLPQIEIQTQGAFGLRYRKHEYNGIQGEWRELLAYRQPVVRDPAGAGDWCTAGLIHALFRFGPVRVEDVTDDQLTDSLRLGQTLAALSCAFEGARGLMYGLRPHEVGEIVADVLNGGSLPRVDECYDARPYRRQMQSVCPHCQIPGREKSGH